MTSFLESFFDDAQPGNYNLWSKNVEDLDVSGETVIFKGSLCKYSKAKNKWKQRHFVLTDVHLLYYRNNTDPKIRGLIKLHLVRNEYIFEGHPTFPEYKFGIRFIKNMKYSDLWVKDEPELRRWQDALSQVCIQSDFHNKFTALKMIGKGSFARVYLVENKTSKEKFAVKAFSKDYLLGQRKGKESLMNEISIMKELTHENVMRLFEVHESQNSIYLILELLEGGELLDFISKNKGKMKLSDFKAIVGSILKALKYMSSKNIMHRDLKPENMILKNKLPLEQNVLKIVDLGLATHCDETEYLFKRCGTPGFVAPEVVNAPSDENIHYSPKCDVFSAGVIFYLILAGKTPFPGKTFKTILQNNKECRIKYDLEELKTCPPEAISLLKKMLEPDPQHRLSASECLDHEFFREEGEEAKEHPSTEDTGMDGMEEFVIPNSDLGKIKDKYVMVTKNLMKHSKDPGISLEFRAPCINGHTDSYQDSLEMNSRNQIDSFNHMNNPSSPKPKKDSIYKTALQKQGGSSKMIGLIKPVPSEFDSVCSGASSREDLDKDNESAGSVSRNGEKKTSSSKVSRDNSVELDRNSPTPNKKSRFGQKTDA